MPFDDVSARQTRNISGGVTAIVGDDQKSIVRAKLRSQRSNRSGDGGRLIMRRNQHCEGGDVAERQLWTT
ncbi:hypothetical protein GCM10023325_20320 [Sphingomonas lutea]